MSAATKHIETEKQLVPALRFNEFEDNWNFKKLGKIYKINAGGDINENHVSPIKTDKYQYPIYANAIKCKGFYAYSDIYKVEPNTITVAGRGAHIGIAHARDHRFYPIVRLLVLKPLNEEDIYFSEYAINRINLFKESTGVPQLTGPQMSGYEISLPGLPEQQKIASFLSAVDDKIQQLTKKKTLLEQYKKGVMQQLFSGQLRFKDENGNLYPDWEDRKMSEVLFEHKLNSTGNEEVFSVSVHKGLVNQVEHLGRVFAAKNTDNYNLVQPGDIVYTKSPTGSFSLGIIKQSKMDKNVIVSPLYGIFTPETPGLGYLFNVFFESPINVKNYLASIIQKGAKNTINITNTTFLSKKMKLPVSKEEQNIIGDFLKEIDVKIAKTNNQITQTQTFKKGLLQQMFV